MSTQDKKFESNISKESSSQYVPSLDENESDSEGSSVSVSQKQNSEAITNQPQDEGGEHIPKNIEIDVRDPFGLLQSEHMAAAAADATLASKSRKRKYKSEAEKLEANRKSAAESRLRKKVVLMKLQEEVSMLRKENSVLYLENEEMKKKIALQQEALANSNLVSCLNPSILSRASTLERNIPLVQNQLLLPGGPSPCQLPYPMAVSDRMHFPNMKQKVSEENELKSYIDQIIQQKLASHTGMASLSPLGYVRNQA